MSSDKYFQMNKMQLMMFPVVACMSNRNIVKIRAEQ